MTDAEITLREFLQNVLEELKYCQHTLKIQTINSGGANYTSALFFVDVATPGRDDLKLFAKVAAIPDAMRKYVNGTWLYETERIVYTHLAKIYDEIQNRHEIPEDQRFVFPKFYGCSTIYEKETVVMENLVASGYNSYDRLKSMDWEYATAAVQTLARFHALSFAFEKEYPEEFEKFVSERQFNMTSSEPNESSMGVWQKIKDRALSVIKEEYRERVMNVVLTHKKMDVFNKPINKAVVAHGDYRFSNLLFRRQNDRLETMAVDFQTVHAGCAVTDLVYLLFMASDEEFRRQYYDQFLDFYYQELCTACEKLDVDAAEVYPRETFDSEWKQTLPYAIIIGIVILPLVTVEAESAPKVESNDVSTFAMKANELFAQRFSGLVNDCVRLGAI